MNTTNTKSAKQKAAIALKQIIEAARRYIEAEIELEQKLRSEKQNRRQVDAG